ncbi:DNA repair protein RAD51 homolog 3 isoform X2 [Orussus abietinus]|uniref:DNA repair protein RAD51 homolog 3 isoform X2 n=1 Tax=Orussus abietinus TaxID=222816 RepID=UPI0006267F60|nr:DNA repair protein RAD51 homolog 3 isoform X2 [Orussus abietinus]
MLQPISTLALPNSAISGLLKDRYIFMEDIITTPEKLTKYVTSLVSREALEIPQTHSALDVWQKEMEVGSISTCCKILDDTFDGGLQRGSITELFGAPGSGKTQICIMEQLNICLNNFDGQVFYFDTRHQTSLLRLKDLILGCQSVQKDQRLNIDDMMKGITVVSPFTPNELLSAITNLKRDLVGGSKVSVIILDSLSYPIQCCLEDSWQRTQVYFRILDELHAIVSKFNVAVIIVNELVTQIDDEGKVCFGSAGGQLLAHLVHRRLTLVRLTDTKFAAHILKHSTLPQVSVVFEIISTGVRDVSKVTTS